MKAQIVALTVFSVSSLIPVAQAATTPPYGYTTVTCLQDADTIVGLPMRQNSAFTGTISGDPSAITGGVRLTVSGSPGFTVNEYQDTHYVKFTSGASDGEWYAITANAAGTIDVDLNGATENAANGDSFEVLKFWTLAELIAPGDATNDATTTPNAIVASATTSPRDRRTLLLYPDIVNDGINRSADKIYYIDAASGEWKDASDNSTADGVQLWPDVLFTVRHPSTVTANTTYTVMGEVETNDFKIPLGTSSSGARDNYVAIPRPVDVELQNLGLGGTSGFVSSASTSPRDRRDLLFVYDNTASGINKSASVIYYYDGGAGLWRDAADNSDASTDTIKAGAGIVIRKYATAGGETHFWQNSSPY